MKYRVFLDFIRNILKCKIIIFQHSVKFVKCKAFWLTSYTAFILFWIVSEPTKLGEQEVYRCRVGISVRGRRLAWLSALALCYILYSAITLSDTGNPPGNLL